MSIFESPDIDEYQLGTRYLDPIGVLVWTHRVDLPE
jgi:hypothetical protein